MVDTVNRSTMNRFSVFVLFYMTAVVLEMSKDWEDPAYALFFLLLAVGTALTGITCVKFLVFLVLTTGYFLIVHFPEVANHVNLIIYCNTVMILAMAYSFVRRRGSVADGEYFEMICPMLRVSLIMVYFLAGFHKLNRDYFNPEVSCATGMLSNVVSMMRSSILGVPVIVMLAAVGLLFVYRIIGGTRFGTPGSPAYTLLVVLCVGGVLCGVLILLLEADFGTPAALILSISLATGVLVILWELIGSLLLAVPRFQVVIVPFSLIMHCVLAMVGFVDFGALAFSLLFTFVPPSYYQVLNRHANLRFSGFVVHRAHVYFSINIMGAVLSGIDVHIHDFLNRGLIAGILFNSAVLICIWPILSTVFSPLPIWGGVPVLNRRMPMFLYVFPVLLFLFGMTSYLGLRTAGNFSMFSNLQTEGNGSNHLVFKDNPLKVWDYQEDVVRIIEIDDNHGEIIHHYDRSPRGHELPVVEFRKWIYEWTQAGLEVPLTFEYRGRIYSTKDIVKEPVWRTYERSWEMVLMDFRVIQPTEPNQCRW